MENIIYENGENFLIKKKFAEQFLNECLASMLENTDLDDENIEYLRNENQSLIEELKQFDDEEIICFGECAMSGYFMIYQDRVQYYLDLIKESEEI